LPQTPGAHHERLAFAATKIIEQTGFAHLRSRLTFDGSDRNSAACVAMNASRGFPPYSRCHWISVRSPGLSQQQACAGRCRLHEEVEVSHCRLRHRAAVYQRLDHCPQCRAQPAQGPDVRQVSTRYACPLDPPPSMHVAISRQEIIRRRRSGRRDGIDQVHGHNRLADYGEAPGTRSANSHIESIGIRYFYECHELFETLGSLPCGCVM
jgi:hypothetical protein